MIQSIFVLFLSGISCALHKNDINYSILKATVIYPGCQWLQGAAIVAGDC